MKLLIEWDSGSRILDPENSYRLGRDSSADIELTDTKISRFHIRITFKSETWLIEDLDSSNGTFSGKTRITKLPIAKATQISVGGIDHFVIKLTPLTSYHTTQVKVSEETSYFESKTQQIPHLEDSTKRIRLQNRIRIGRNQTSDWVIPDPNVSRNHAEIVQSNSGMYEIVDLKSMNGTFVNGVPIKREILSPGDLIRIGTLQRIFTMDGLENIEGTDGSTIELQNVTFSIKNKVLLNSINLNLRPRTLTAVIGPSGAGKSTLLGVLTGRTKPSSGNVNVNGIDLHKNFQEISRNIGFVPQLDIIHSRLTVREALEYGARLRFPSDTSRSERDSRIDEVLQKLDLVERANLRIDKLSGGQRKRASIGLELLTNPQILVLDEPTSGLDPALDAHVMETLRDLADEGQTIVVVTHSIENLNICDNVVLLASGGNLIYSGPSSSVFQSLRKKNWAEVFRLLASSDALNFVQRKFPKTVSTEINQNHTVIKRQKFISRVTTLSSRYVRVIFSDRFYLSLLFSIPVLVGLISYSAGSEYGMGKGISKGVGLSYNPYAQGTILVLVLGSIFIGLSTGIQEIVKENPIRIREQSLGISPLSYVTSKMLVLTLIVVIQIGIFNSIVLFRRPLPDHGLLLSSSFAELLGISCGLSLCSMFLSLFISSFLTSNEQAMPSLVGLTLIQIVLSGALPLGSNNFLAHFAKISPSYWATNAFSASINLVEIAHVKDRLNLDKWEYSVVTVGQSFIYLALFSVFFFLVSTTRVRFSR